MKAGNEYTVVFTAPDIDITSGYQATLTFDNEALELVDIIEGVAKVDNFGLRYLEEGLITTSWNSTLTSHFPLPNSEMFSLVFRAREDARLSELLGISSRITKAEAYNTDGEYMDVAIEFSESTVAADKFELYQNRPNPFREETIISFNLTQADQVTVTIADVSGRTLKLVRLDGVKGYNELKLKRGTLPTGVLSYSVKSGQDTATKKMILTE